MTAHGKRGDDLQAARKILCDHGYASCQNDAVCFAIAQALTDARSPPPAGPMDETMKPTMTPTTGSNNRGERNG